MKLVNPVVAASTVGAQLAPRLSSLEGTTIGLWSNAKLNADELLGACEAELHGVGELCLRLFKLSLHGGELRQVRARLLGLRRLGRHRAL